MPNALNKPSGEAPIKTLYYTLLNPDLRERVPEDLQRVAFTLLEGEWLYHAGKKWGAVTDEQRREAFSRLEGEWLYLAGKE